MKALSADGRYVVFESRDNDLTPDNDDPDPDGRSNDVFVHDRLTGITTRVNLTSSGAQANSRSSDAALSSDGRFVAFDSKASNLVAGDTNGLWDVFVNDRAAACGSSGSPMADVLRINASRGVVTVAPRTRIDVTLNRTPAGPPTANYGMWVWRQLPLDPRELVILGETIGCIMNPTPFAAPITPQPIKCLHGGLGGPDSCGSVSVVSSPPTAPFTLSRNCGLGAGFTRLVQGVIEDAAATNSFGLSVTNPVILRVLAACSPDADLDGVGDVCDTDDDDDGVLDVSDNCPLTFNPDQTDENDNGAGDVCEPISISCPGAIGVDLGPGQCSATVTSAVTGTGTCPPVTVACVPASGSVFPAGQTVVQCSATDCAATPPPGRSASLCRTRQHRL